MEDMKGKALSKSQVRDLVQDRLRVALKTVYNSGSVANQVWEIVLHATRNPQLPGLHTVKEDCNSSCGTPAGVGFTSSPPPYWGGEGEKVNR